MNNATEKNQCPVVHRKSLQARETPCLLTLGHYGEHRFVGLRPPVVIYGPPGCGKTRHTREILKWYGYKHVVDDESDPTRTKPLADNTVYLTSIDLTNWVPLAGIVVLSFDTWLVSFVAWLQREKLPTVNLFAPLIDSKVVSAAQMVAEREATHGSFNQGARLSQGVKNAMLHAPKWSELSEVQREALQLIATKLGRILCGDPKHIDTWVDIGGYAQLVVDDLQRLQGQRHDDR